MHPGLQYLPVEYMLDETLDAPRTTVSSTCMVPACDAPVSWRIHRKCRVSQEEGWSPGWQDWSWWEPAGNPSCTWIPRDLDPVSRLGVGVESTCTPQHHWVLRPQPPGDQGCSLLWSMLLLDYTKHTRILETDPRTLLLVLDYTKHTRILETDPRTLLLVLDYTKHTRILETDPRTLLLLIDYTNLD